MNKLSAKCIHLLMIVFTAPLLLGSCIFNYDHKQYSNNYQVIILNQSPDSLLFSSYHNGWIYNPVVNKENVIYSNHTKNLGRLGFDGNRNPQKMLFKNHLTDEHFWVYAYTDELIQAGDSQSFFLPDTSQILIKWDGPPKNMSDSIHHFFNYSSWEVIAYPEDSTVDGVLVFTITADDLK